MRVQFSLACHLHWESRNVKQEESSMVDNVLCTVLLPEQANEAVARMEKLGFRSDEVIVARDVSEVENLIHTEADMTRSTLIGVAYGAIAGFLLGLGQMVFLGPTIWSMWGAAAIPIFNAGCWALIGSIIGCGGILSSRKVSSEVAHQLEREVEQSRLLVAVPLHNKAELARVKATLSEVGATNIHYTGKVA
jgi:hypothetical protein